MPPLVKLYEPGGVTELGEISITATAGTPSDPILFEAWNRPGDAGADTATEISIHDLERRVGEVQWTQERDVTMHRWLELRVTGTVGSGVIEDQAVDWTPVGQGRPFYLKPIPGDSGRQVEARLNIPAGEQPDAIELRFRVVCALPAVPLASGLHAAGLRGIPSGLGDGLASYLFAGGGLSPSTVPDGHVRVADLVAVIAGERRFRIGSAEAINDTASDGALAAGESYLLTVSVGAGGLTLTKGAKGAYPLPVGARPAVPTGELLLGYVEKRQGATITAGNITNAQTFGAFKFSADGLTATISGGEGLLDDRMIRRDGGTSLSLPPSSPFSIYLLPSGYFDLTRSDPRAALIFRGETDGAGVVSVEDVRPYLRTRPGRISFRIDATLAAWNGSGSAPAGSVAYATFPGEADGVPTLPWSWIGSLHSVGGGTAGATIFEIERWDGAAWSSLFPSAGTADRRPAFAFDGSPDITAAGHVEDAIISPRTRMRLRVVQVPTGGAAPGGCDFDFLFEVP
jgi:hypothetical protein